MVATMPKNPAIASQIVTMPAPTFLARSLTELISLRAAKTPDLPAVHTGTAEFGNELQTLTYSQIARAVDRLAKHYSDLATTINRTGTPEQVISVLISTAIDESLLEIALAKLGLTPLLLSVNNSAAAVAHLIKQTKSTHLLYGPKFADTAGEVAKQLASEGIEVEIVPEKRFPLWGKGGVDESMIEKVIPRLAPEQEARRTCVILHSSGSTGFPKPVYITHFGLIANLHSALPLSGFSALPLFHGFGHFSIFRCVYHAQPFTLIPPHLPLTSANICRVIRESPTPPLQHFAVPYVLKLLGETQEGIETLASFQAVSFAGAAVPDDLGDRLVSAGVNLITIYGTTETGTIFNSRRDYENDKAWNWCRAEGMVADYLQMEPKGGDTYELVVRDGWPAKILSNRSDGSYATKDLFLQHPGHRTWYKYIGRLDDTLTQNLGEKTNPVPIELAIRGNSPLISECIVFGDARPQVGCLILPSDQAGELWRDRSKFVDAIWPVIADANANAPTHSRILPEMIGILPAGTEIPVATKMSILRPACYKKFAGLIGEIYDCFENGNGQAKKVIETQQDMEAFLEDAVVTALGSKHTGKLSRDTDLFAYGVDSLQATRVRNVIMKSVELGGATLGQNVVYEHPSIAQLATFLLSVKTGKGGGQTVAQQHAVMTQMVDKWSTTLLNLGGSNVCSLADGPVASGHVVLLTGATGSLGAHILDSLTASPNVDQVICLSRAKSHEDSRQRVDASLALRQRSLSAAQEAKIHSLAADVNRPKLGLTDAEYEELCARCTAVIHNAWPVNFVLSIESFDDHVGGAVNLLEVTLRSPRARKPTFLFSSSVGTVQGRPDAVIPEDFPDSPATAAGMGYGRSKWVVEKVMERAAQQTQARVGVLRIGQLVGDTEKGVWNETEAWPLMFKAVDTIHALPRLEERLSWLPVNQAGRAIAEVATSSTDAKAAVYHILNPADSATFDAVAEGLRLGGKQFEVVDRKEWLERLAASDQDVVNNPSYKLLTFYQNRIGNTQERARMVFDVAQTCRVAPTISQCEPVSPELVALWTRAWKASKFMQ